MRIGEIRDPNLFQRLVQSLYVAERGVAFQIVDDSGGDAGNDGYDTERGILLSIYCPEKPDSADYLRKGRSDLNKVMKLKSKPGYSIREWWFVVPTELREPVQSNLRSAGNEHGLPVSFIGEVHLEDLYRKHPHLHDKFPELAYPIVAAKLDQLLDGLPKTAVETAPVRDVDTAPLQSPLSSTPEPTHSSILEGFPPARLLELAARLDQDDAGALAELERFRMESLDLGSTLSSMLVELDYEQNRANRSRVLEIAEAGLHRSRGSKFDAELAVFAANVAFERTFSLVKLDLESVGFRTMEMLSGVHLVPEEKRRKDEAEVRELANEIDALLREALDAVKRSNNLTALYLVLIRRASIITQRHFPFAHAASQGGSESAAVTVKALYAEMQGVYETAIKTAVALGSDQRLATAYGNFANDLFAFGELDRSEQHAIYALSKAESVADRGQIAKTSYLLRRIRETKSAPSREAAI
ncbi:hypothetical protein [Gemmatimonas sp.]|jgi:hypothetical protein|uniref:hypothetical protein n=1 Tax=Gemmatimonas sp. TaxID=1962908 RepID=UPI0037C142A4